MDSVYLLPVSCSNSHKMLRNTFGTIGCVRRYASINSGRNFRNKGPPLSLEHVSGRLYQYKESLLTRIKVRSAAESNSSMARHSALPA